MVRFYRPGTTKEPRGGGKGKASSGAGEMRFLWYLVIPFVLIAAVIGYPLVWFVEWWENNG